MWDEVWNAHDPDAVDRFVTDDVVVVIGGKEISGKDDFKDSIRELLDNVEDLHLDAIETFQNEDGTRVTSR
jgi:ketosteroid isomerase-like protein